MRGPITPGTPSAPRTVPPWIPHPEYVGKPAPARTSEPLVKDAATIEKMRHASRIAADALAVLGRAVRPGISTDELDGIGHDYLVNHGAYPSTLGYRGYPKSVCTSLNEVICHGIPDSTTVQNGDILNIDITAYIDGVHGDTNATFLAGTVGEDARMLVERTHEAMMRGIRAARAGRPVNVIGRVIESYARRFGYGVVREFTGHGVGTVFHNGLVIPHYDDPSFDGVIEEGMTFTIEPMITLGSPAPRMWENGWTAVTADGSWTAQFEHTILITGSGAEILTVAQDGTAAAAS